MSRPRAVLLALLCLVCPVQAATLRHNVVLRSDKVHLSDLFDHLSPGQDTVLGDAPPPGKSYDVGGSQLTAIAAQYGVDWPDASPLTSITVTRGAHVYGHAYAVALLRDALHVRQGDPDAEVALEPFQPLVVPLEITGEPTLTRLDYTPDVNGTFSATLILDLPTPLQVQLHGAVFRQVDVVTVTRPVPAGMPLLADSLTITRIRADHIPPDALHNPEDIVGLTARTTLLPGHPITPPQLSHPILIQKNAAVVMAFDLPSLHVTTSGIALEDGGRNDLIRILNPSTQMVVTGRVDARSEVEILPGTTPVPADLRQMSGHVPPGWRRS